MGLTLERATTNIPLTAKLAVAGAAVAGTATLLITQAFAASTVYVTPVNTQGWSTAETRSNGTVEIVADADTPYGDAALRLATGANTGSPQQDKAQYMHVVNTKLGDVTSLSYWTKQVSASFEAGLPSYQLPVCLYGVTETGCAPVPGGTTSGFTTLVYEPYVDQGNAAVQANTWQQWDAYAGKWWSSKTVGGLVVSQGATTYTMSTLKTMFPDAVVVGYGVNVGSNNPYYDTRVDGFVFNGTVYDFELTAVPSTKEQCKDGGWKNMTNSQGGAFKNQGQCVAYVVSSQNSALHR